MLAIFVEIMGGKLVLNERNPLRYDLLTQLFPDALVITREDSQAEDFPGKIRNAFKGDISGVMMNPPKKISMIRNKEEWPIEAQHVAGAVASTTKNGGRLYPSGRAVVISTLNDLEVFTTADSINVHNGMYRKGQTEHQTYFHVLESKRYDTNIKTEDTSMQP